MRGTLVTVLFRVSVRQNIILSACRRTDVNRVLCVVHQTLTTTGVAMAAVASVDG